MSTVPEAEASGALTVHSVFEQGVADWSGNACWPPKKTWPPSRSVPYTSTSVKPVMSPEVGVTMVTVGRAGWT